jgi:DnaK suppressor protein
MNTTLTPGQRAQLRELLELQQHELDRRISSHVGSQGRVAHAAEVLDQDADDAPQRNSDREVDLAQADRELIELGAVSRALSGSASRPTACAWPAAARSRSAG